MQLYSLWFTFCFLEGSKMYLKTCTKVKGMAGSCKNTHKGIIEMEAVDKNRHIITIKTTELYVPSLQCCLFIPQIYLK